jgi:hypothetical protein
VPRERAAEVDLSENQGAREVAHCRDCAHLIRVRMPSKRLNGFGLVWSKSPAALTRAAGQTSGLGVCNLRRGRRH